MRRLSSLKTLNVLSVAVCVIEPTEDGDPPLYGQVVFPDRMVKTYPARKRNYEQLSGLELHRLAALLAERMKWPAWLMAGVAGAVFGFALVACVIEYLAGKA